MPKLENEVEDLKEVCRYIEVCNAARACREELMAIKDTMQKGRISLIQKRLYSGEVKAEFATCEDSVWQAIKAVNKRLKELGI